MNNNLIENRQIRVFISSTFRDMQDERDYLMKRTFPKLRKLAAERDVTLTELDLRWGITEEEAKTGKVVEICLQEIENCIPFFIGIIGNRYGWVPEKKDINENVTDRFKDVDSYLERHLSVTEMEMQFGVLQRQEDMHAFFYIKEGEDKEDADNPEMLERLKKEVKASRYPSATYSSPENLAQQVEKSFIALLDQLFPKGHLSKLEKERIGQRSFMNQLCQNYIRDEHYFKVLDNWLHDTNARQLVITGDSGLGKSALIANWVKEKLDDTNREYNIIYHFTGNGGCESSHSFIADILVNEINDIYGWINQHNIHKSKDEEIAKELHDLFSKIVSIGKPLLIVLDAINQIIDTDYAKLLKWLPIPPQNIKFLFSTLNEDQTMGVFRDMNYPIITIHPLNYRRRQQLVKSYLNLFAKKLTPEQIERIVRDRQCKNTLVLKMLLQELINYGIYGKLDTKINYYLSKESIEDFYEAILRSYEKEFGVIFVKTTLSLIALSEKGLNEEEIISISESKHLHWVQFYHLFASHLIVKNGLITFSHEFIRRAVGNRYINDKKWSKICSQKIITFFKNIESIRSYKELTYQYLITEQYDSLHRQLLSLPYFSYLYHNDSTELFALWTAVIANGYPYEAIRKVLLSAQINTSTRIKYLTEVIVFSILELHFHPAFADILCRDSAAKLDYNLGNECENLARLYKLIGDIYSIHDSDFMSLSYLKKALFTLKRNCSSNSSLMVELCNSIADIYIKQGNNNKALLFYQKKLTIQRNSLGYYCIETGMTYAIIGEIYNSKCDFSHALNYYHKALAIFERVKGESHPETISFYNEIAWNLHLLGKDKYALIWIRKVFPTYSKSHECIDTLASIYQGLGLNHLALEKYESCLKLKKEQNATEKSIQETEAKIAKLKELMKNGGVSEQ